jgi:hypothetical protein
MSKHEFTLFDDIFASGAAAAEMEVQPVVGPIPSIEQADQPLTPAKPDRTEKIEQVKAKIKQVRDRVRDNPRPELPAITGKPADLRGALGSISPIVTAVVMWWVDASTSVQFLRLTLPIPTGTFWDAAIYIYFAATSAYLTAHFPTLREFAHPARNALSMYWFALAVITVATTTAFFALPLLATQHLTGYGLFAAAIVLSLVFALLPEKALRYFVPRFFKGLTSNR